MQRKYGIVPYERINEGLELAVAICTKCDEKISLAPATLNLHCFWKRAGDNKSTRLLAITSEIYKGQVILPKALIL